MHEVGEAPSLLNEGVAVYVEALEKAITDWINRGMA
jgi:hypothetical protein